ncbi:MAG TPA: hypothetical protein PLS10_13660 [Chitinophagales bacterium]|nr:hypothetical protein [Chitinophagales bacterium]
MKKNIFLLICIIAFQLLACNGFCQTTSFYNSAVKVDSVKFINDSLHVYNHVDGLVKYSLPSGGGGILPNGVEIVSTTRNFQASDAGKIIVLFNHAGLDMPSGSLGLTGENYCSVISQYQDSYVQRGSEGEQIYMNSISPTLSNNESLLLTFSEHEAQAFVSPVNASLILDGDTLKTASRYFYDKQNDYIPLSGTVSGSPVTGDIEVKEGSYGNLYLRPDDTNIYQYLLFSEGGINLASKNYDNDNEVGITIGTIASDGGITIYDDNINSHGIAANQDFTSNLRPLDYTQKKYVDQQNGNDTITLNTDDPLVYSGDTLYVPAGKGKINLTGSTGQGTLTISNIVTSTQNIPLRITKTVSGTNYQFLSGGNILTKNYGNPILYLDEDYIKIEWFELIGKFQTVDYYSYD